MKDVGYQIERSTVMRDGAGNHSPAGSWFPMSNVNAETLEPDLVRRLRNDLGDELDE